MRKTLWLAAVLALLLSLTACSGGGEAPSPAVPEDQHVSFLQRKLILAGKFFQTAVLHETDHPEPQQLFRQFLKRKYRQFLRRFRLCRQSCFRFEFHLAADMPLDTAVQRLL